MPSPLKISEAASLALHTMVLLASRNQGKLSTREMAEGLSVSEAHLAKVLQRLGRAGLVKSRRGPGGGFTLGKQADEITLLDVYEVTEGRLERIECLMAKPACNGDCILGGLLESVNRQVKEYLAAHKLSDLAGSFTLNK